MTRLAPAEVNAVNRGINWEVDHHVALLSGQ